jgi:hypothetical protein
MKTIRFDVAFEVEDCNEEEFLDSYREFMELWEAEMKLYKFEEIPNYEYLLGL